MNRKSASLFLGISLNILFTALFLLMISYWKADSGEITLHMNQVGVFKESANAESCKEKIRKMGMEAYSYENDDLIMVVTSLNLNENLCIEDQKKLSSKQISSVLKKVTSSDSKFKKAVESNDYETVMELMSELK